MILKQFLDIAYINTIKLCQGENKIEFSNIEDLGFNEKNIILVKNRQVFALGIREEDLEKEFIKKEKSDIFDVYTYEFMDYSLEFYATDIMDAGIEEKIISKYWSSSFDETKKKYFDDILSLKFIDLDLKKIWKMCGKDIYNQNEKLYEMLMNINIYEIEGNTLEGLRKRLLLKYLQNSCVINEALPIEEILKDIFEKIASKKIYNDILKTDKEKEEFEKFKKMIGKIRKF